MKNCFKDWRQYNYGPAHENHMSKRNGLTEHAQLASETRYLTIGLNFYLLLYFVCVINERLDEPVLKHRHV